MMLKNLNWNLFSKYRNELFGLAVIGIIVLHYFEDVTASDATGGLILKVAQLYSWLIGSTGVDIFLFLSGMGLFYSLKKKYDIKLFYINRLKRLLIPCAILGIVYWIYIDLVYAHTGVMQFLADLFLISFWTQGETHFWYVSFILLCYLCYPFLFRLFSNGQNAARNFIILSAVYVILVTAVSLLASEWYGLVEIGLTRFWVFLFGAWAGEWIYDKRKIRYPLLVLLGIPLRLLALGMKFIAPDAAVVFDISYPLNRWIISWCGMAIMLLCVVLLDAVKNEKLHRCLSVIGAYSLELYIVHVSVRTVMNRNGLFTYQLHYYLVVIAASVIISLLLRWCSDKILKALP